MLNASDLVAIQRIEGNEDSLRMLIEQMKTPRSVIPFVGAGMSIPFGYPSWTSFLMTRARQVKKGQEVKKRIEEGKYEEAAEDLQAALGPRDFPDAISNAFGDHKLHGKTITGAVTLIPEIASGPVITTNFDHLLESAYEKVGKPFSRIIVGAKPDLIQRSFQQGLHVLLKIHGDFEDRSDRILTFSEYERHYGSDVNNNFDFEKPLPKIWRNILTGQTLLFLGCSLNEDRTISILNRIASESPEIAHFAVVEKPRQKEKYQTKRHFLSERGIRPIWYQFGKHQQIEAILQHLANESFVPVIPPQNSKTVVRQSIDRFIGRERETREIAELIGEHKIVTLTGSGGSGKSRLALHVSDDLASSFKDGMCLAELETIEDASLISQSIASALNLREDSSAPPLDIVARYIGDKQMLVILDGCEGSVQACAEAAEFLAHRCLNLKILATSQRPLGCQGEQLYPVPPLATPDPNKPYLLSDLIQFDSVQLFIERAKAVQPSFSLNDADASASARICYLLDGIPFAIELAAARVTHLTTQQIAEQLEKPLSVLTRGKRTAPERLRTMRASLDWTYSLLFPDAQKFLRHLAVFTGGFVASQVEAVCADDLKEGQLPLDQIAELLDLSLLFAQDEGDHKRFRMREVTRQYCLGKMDDTHESEQIRSRYCQLFFNFVMRSSENFASTSDPHIWDEMERHHSNVRSVLYILLSEMDVDRGLPMAVYLRTFWSIRGHLVEGREWLERWLRIAEGYQMNVWVARAYVAVADLSWGQGDYKQAEVLLNSGLSAFEQLGDHAESALALGRLGNIAVTVGDYQVALSYYQRAEHVARENNLLGILTQLLDGLSVVAMSLGDFDSAQDAIEEALVTARRLGDRKLEVGAIYSLGNMYMHQGKWHDAHLCLDQAVAISKTLPLSGTLALMYSSLAIVAFNEGRISDVEHNMASAIAVANGVQDTSVTTIVLCTRADIALMQNDHSQMYDATWESLHLSLQTEDRQGVSRALERFARLAAARAHLIRAAKLFGFVTTLEEYSGFVTPLENEKDYAHYRQKVKDGLGEVIYSQLMVNGGSMSLEEVTAYAVDVDGIE